MTDVRTLRFDVVVVGGGPAGIAAAVAASERRVSVALVDDNPDLGGQVWRGHARSPGQREAARWFARIGASPVKRIHEARVFHVERGRLAAESPDATYQIAFDKLILATGARELFLPFPGWTLPNVVGAGGFEALIRSGLPVAGKRVVIAGTGPLLLAVASDVRSAGGRVLCIAEQTTALKLARFGVTIAGAPEKWREAARLGWELKGVPHWKNSWPLEALGRHRLERVRMWHRGRVREVACDYLACGFHLIPNTELAEYAGCRIDNGFVVVDDRQETSARGIYCAGEPTGIGGLDRALLEGQIAGQAAGGEALPDPKLLARRASGRSVVRALRRAFGVRAELRALARPETLLCRCEDVTCGSLDGHSSWREAKLQTRCGMGPCQGRVCGAAAQFLFGWDVSGVRAPLSPVRCGSLAALSTEPGPNHSTGGSP